jgi:endonuclease YncB( thermonuclease family)
MWRTCARGQTAAQSEGIRSVVGVIMLEHFFRRVASFNTMAEAKSTEVLAADIRVIDGDDIEWRRRNCRLMGFDAPELSKAKSELEWERGLQAARRLHDLIKTAKTLQIPPSGSEDRNQRPLVHLLIDGVDIAKIAIEEGWAYEYHGGRKRPKYWDSPDTPFTTPPALADGDKKFTEAPVPVRKRSNHDTPLPPS